ncbi:MAG: nucleotidyltransferase family protein [Tepidimonas sp.]|uniref:nucleotidyltransferase family protein n=1 Tax=Tepidimonas sp. TaxID=2002775 RepID=UPI0040549FFD
MREHADPKAPLAAALLLAAGRGERMRPLTDTCPKPLLPVRGRPLLAWHLDALARSGVRRALINTAWLGEQIPATLGAAYPGPHGTLVLDYSMEGRDFGHALETAGGIARALPRLDSVFWLAAGDVFMPDFPYDPAVRTQFLASNALAHLWLVPNPPHHPLGDFGLDDEGRALDLPPHQCSERWTYSSVALLRRELFAPPWCDIPPGNPGGIAAPLAPVLRRAMGAGRVTAEVWRGTWADVGTPERLAAVQG